MPQSQGHAPVRESPPPPGGHEAGLAACARGDLSALQALYQAEAGPMLGVARRILRRRTLAEEAVHDAFVLIWRNAQSFDPQRGSARAWMYAVLRHRALNMLRAEQRLELSESPEEAEQPDGQEDPEAVVARLSEEKALKACLDRLEPKRRAAIVMAYVHGLTHAELAGRLDLPLGTVKSWIRRGLSSLRECLG